MRARLPRSVLLAALALALGGRAIAYPITVDGNTADWQLSGATALPLNVNTGHLARGVSAGNQIGEYTWRDAVGDQVAGIGSDIDIVSFHVTASATMLYFRIAMTNLAILGQRYPQVQIAIDRTNSSGSGVRSFGVGCTDQTVAQGAWEYLVVTRFGSGSNPYVFDTSSVDRNTGGATAAMSTATNNIEIGVPWSLIGGVPTYRIHFTVISVESDRSDTARTTAAADAVTNYGHPATGGNTADERSDGVIDYRFDLWFHLDPEYDPAAPVVISEVLPEPSTGDGYDEWIEIFNTSGSAITLDDGWRLGDEETLGDTGGDGMYAFPQGAAIAAGTAQVAAFAADHYFAQYTRYPRYEFVASDPTVANMVRDTTWAGDSGLALGNGDQLLLIDDHFTIVDAVVWGAATQYPGVTAAAVAPTGSSLERTLAYRDTNNCATDFAYNATPTPGVAAGVCRTGLAGNQPDSRACNNGDLCLSGSCSAGSCIDGARRTCPYDGNECSDDVCGSARGDCYPPTAAGVVCADTDALDCHVAQCDGSGTCSQTQGDEPAGADCDGATAVECWRVGCDGNGTCDPSYAPLTAGADCSDTTGGDCRTAACDGSGGCDQTYDWQPADTPCDDDDLFNCLAAQCDASGTCDQMHFPEPPGAPCQDLDPTDCIAAACNASGSCDQAYGIASSSVVCRPAADLCDQPDSCDGVGDTCPGDQKWGSSQLCRAEAVGGCDLAEYCDGASDACPADAKRDSTSVCRGAGSSCDLAESCDGTSDLCPTDLFAADTATCDDGNACTEQTHCNGAGACVPGIVICDAGWPPDSAIADAAMLDTAGRDAAALDRVGVDLVGTDLSAQPYDARHVAAPIESSPGCGCRATGSGSATPLALLVWAAFRLGRRRADASGRRRAR